jgi:single-stranded DNA-binding protein
LARSGNKRYRTEIVAESMQLGPRPSDSASGGNYQAAPAQSSYNPKPASAQGYGEARSAPASGAVKDYGKPNSAGGGNQEQPSEPDIPIIEEDNDIDVKNIPF